MQLSTTHPKRFELSNFETISPEELKRRSKAELEYYKNCQAIFTMGQWISHYLIDQLGIDSRKVHHVGGGINIDRSLISNGQQRKNNKILFIGRDFKRKGGYLTYEAFRILQRDLMPHAELYIVGPANNPINLPCKGYHFIGECPKKQLSDLLNTCDIFCMPSYFEAYGLVFAEALSFGLPCIGRNRYEMPYFIKDGVNGYLIEKDDALFLAHKMYDLLNNQAIQNSVRAMRDTYITKYSWDSVATRIKQHLNN
ncbi:MAG: glycosyltransferase family 4 protein [Bacteroidaceae bacterium]